MIGPNHTFRLRNVRTNLEVKTLINAIRLKPYYDPEDRPTNPPVELADNEEELDPEELDQPRQQKQGKTNNADTQQGGNVNRNQNVDLRSQPEKQNEPKRSNQQTKRGNEVVRPRNVDQNVDQRSQPERQNEPKRSIQQTKTGKTVNKSVRPRDGSQVKDKQVRPQKGNDKNSGKGGRTAASRQIQQTGSRINDGESIACRRNVHGKMSHHDNQSNRETTQVNKGRSKQESSLGRSNQNSSKQSGQNAKQKHKKQISAQKTATSNSGNKVENKQANQKQMVTGSRAGRSKQKQEGKKVVIPSCIDCKAGNCKPIKETDIKAIVASQRSNGALYYKLKWQDNSTDWYFPCKIPSHMIREYHANRTMSGKKRKKPLHNKQHKFFTETDPQVNVAAKQSKSEASLDPTLLAVKILNGRSYYLVKIGNDTPQWQPICTAHDLATDIITKIYQEREDLLYNLRIQEAKESNQSQIKQPVHCPTVRYIHEMELRTDGHWYCLLSFTKSEIPPEWLKLINVPLGITDNFRKFLSKEYKTYVWTKYYS